MSSNERISNLEEQDWYLSFINKANYNTGTRWHDDINQTVLNRKSLELFATKMIEASFEWNVLSWGQFPAENYLLRIDLEKNDKKFNLPSHHLHRAHLKLEIFIFGFVPNSATLLFQHFPKKL